MNTTRTLVKSGDIVMIGKRIDGTMEWRRRTVEGVIYDLRGVPWFTIVGHSTCFRADKETHDSSTLLSWRKTRTLSLRMQDAALRWNVV